MTSPTPPEEDLEALIDETVDLIECDHESEIDAHLSRLSKLVGELPEGQQAQYMYLFNRYHFE